MHFKVMLVVDYWFSKWNFTGCSQLPNEYGEQVNEWSPVQWWHVYH